MSSGHRVVIMSFRSLAAAAFLFVLSVTAHIPSPTFAQQEIPVPDDDSKGDISTENNPNIGQTKNQVLQEQKQDDRNTEKKDQSASPDKPSNTGRNDARPERPQRFERPMRPERPHR